MTDTTAPQVFRMASSSDNDRQAFKYALTFNQLTPRTIEKLIDEGFLCRANDMETSTEHKNQAQQKPAPAPLALREGHRVLICGSPFNVKLASRNADVAQLIALASAYQGVFCAEAFGPIHADIVNHEMNLRTLMPYKLGIDWFIPGRIAKAAELAKTELNKIKEGAGDQVERHCTELLGQIGTEDKCEYTSDDHHTWLTTQFGPDYLDKSRSFHAVSWLNLYGFTEQEKEKFSATLLSDGENLSHKLRWIPNFFLLFKAVPVVCGRGAVSDGVNYACMLAWLAGLLENRATKIPLHEAQFALRVTEKLVTLPCISMVFADMEPDDWLAIGSQDPQTKLYFMVKNIFVAERITQFVEQNSPEDHRARRATYCVDPDLDNLTILTNIYYRKEELDAYLADAQSNK